MLESELQKIKEQINQKAEESADAYATPDLESSFRAYIYEAHKDGYIAGATENGIVWHDLRKDPNDLPNDYRSVWTNKGGACHDNYGWYDDHGWVNGVIAWCEPQFKE